MNIYITIAFNILIALLLIVGVISGLKNGFKVQIIKFVLSLGALVGCYFLTPILCNLLLSIEAINVLVSSSTILTVSFTSMLFLIEFVLVYLLILLGIKLFKPKEKTLLISTPIKLNNAKPLKNIVRKINRGKRSKLSNFFGVLFGLIIAFIFGYCLFIPVNNILTEISSDPELSTISTCYDNTIYGLIDNNIFNVTDFLNK